MGRGWLTLRHHGEFYRIYDRHASFSELGKRVTTELTADNKLEERLTLRRRLLDLATVVDHATLVDTALLQAPISGPEANEWEITQKALGALSTGPVTEWFAGTTTPAGIKNGMELAQHCNDQPLAGDGLYIEFIYLVDMDSKKFFAQESLSAPKITFHFPMDSIPDNWVEQTQRENAHWYLPTVESFPLPKVILEPLMDDIGKKGYTVKKEISLSTSAGVYQALQNESEKLVFIKTFFSVRRAGNYLRLGATYLEEWHTKPMAIADLLIAQPHPNVVPILAKTHFSNRPSLVLAAFHGSLIDEIQREETGDTDDGKFRNVCHALGQAAEGIMYLHLHGAVHNDIKLENILCRRDATNNNDERYSICAAICDFESIGVPSFEESDERWKDLNWGPYHHDGRKESVDKADGQLWCKGWAPKRWTDAYSHPDRETTSPWSLDSHALGHAIEISAGFFSDNRPSELSLKNHGPLSNVVKTLKRDTDNYAKALVNLESAAQLLKGI